jgi:hypothetical protein
MLKLAKPTVSYALSICAVAALLAGCGGSQPPIGAPGGMLQSRAVATHAERGGSWMLPEAKSEDLLYVSDSDEDLVFVYSYPKRTLVQTLTLQETPEGLCSDLNGDVYVTAVDSISQSYIYEYAHGGSQPIATYNDPGAVAGGCASDPVTGNLAVTNYVSGSGTAHGDVAVFNNASGVPQTYFDPKIPRYFLCTYDSLGNLYVTGGTTPDFFDELPAGGDALSEITLNQSIIPASIQSVADELIITNATGVTGGDLPVYQVQVSGSSGSVVGSTLLATQDHRYVANGQYFTKGHTIMGPGLSGSDSNLVNFWRYPKGGLPKHVLRVMHRRGTNVFGITISAARS